MDDELKNNIKSSIKNEILCRHLLKWLEIESTLDSLPNASSKTTIELSERVEKKIKDCLQIKKNLTHEIEVENTLVLVLENIIVNLSIIFSGRLDKEEYKKSYTEIKDIFINIIKYEEGLLSVSDKFKCLELIDELLLKNILDYKDNNFINIVNLRKEIYKTIIDFKVSIKNNYLFSNNFPSISSKFHKLKDTFLEIKKNPTSHVKRNCKQLILSSTNRVTQFFSEKLATDRICEKVNKDQNTTKKKSILNQAKAQLLLIKGKLNACNLVLSDYTYQHNSKMDTVSIDLEQRPESLLIIVTNLLTNIDVEFSELIQRIFDEFENINAKIKNNCYWLEKTPINKASFFEKLQRGYFNINFSIKKIKDKLGDEPTFSEITDFISQQGFWTLLFTFGILRWPRADKVFFAHHWAEQLCLPEMIGETEKLKNLDSDEEFLKKVITLSEKFFPYKTQSIVQILNNFKTCILITYERLEILHKKIEDSLMESNSATSLDTPTNGFFGKKFILSNSEVIHSMTKGAMFAH